MINSIIDLNHNDTIDFDKCQAAGIVAIIHKVTEGTFFVDPLYQQRKATAKARGFLWGGYHFSSGEDVATQVDKFLSNANFANDELIALDWEESSGSSHPPNMTLEQAVEFVTRVQAAAGRYPVLYGAGLMRTALGTTPNATLANCPLWYARYASTPVGIPNTWQNYTLWQYTEGEDFNDNFPGVNNGGACDRNKFDGTTDDLKRAWPLT